MHKQVVIFDNAAMLPVYVVKMATGDPRYPPLPMHPAAHGPGAAVKEPLKGLEAQAGSSRPPAYGAPSPYAAPAEPSSGPAAVSGAEVSAPGCAGTPPHASQYIASQLYIPNER